MNATDTARPAFRECGPLEQPPRDSQAFCQLLLDQLPIGVFHKDRDGRYVFVNSWFCRLQGATADEYLGKTAWEVTAGRWTRDGAEQPGKSEKTKLLNEGADHHALIMQTGLPIEMEEHYADADGKERYFHAIQGPLIGPDGTIIGSQGILLDITGRKQAEAQLANERDLLRALLNSSTDAIYFKNRQSRFLRCSAAMAPLFHLSSPDELIGKSDFDFQGEEHARRAFEDEQEIIRTGRPMIDKTEKEAWPDGRVTWALTSKMPFYDSHGEIIGTLGISKNITAFKEAEEALRSQEERTRLMIDQAFDAVITTDIDFKIIGWNRQAQTTLGWTRADILGCDLVETVVPPGRRAVRRTDLARFKATGHWHDLNRLIETTAMHCDGRELPVELTMTPIRCGENSIFTIFIRDITERRQTEAALARERHLLESLLENSLDSIYFKDRDSRFLRCSKSLSQKMPGGAADLIGKTDFDLFAEEHARPAFQDEQEIIRTGCPLIGKVEREVAKDGRESWVLTSKMPLRDKAGQIVGTCGISKDITAIKQAEAELERAHKQLVQASRLAGMAEVATSVLHNVGNVLNSVNVSATLLLDNARQSKVSSLGKAVALLNAHAADVAAYLADDPKGRQFPAYLNLLCEELAKEQQRSLAELESVRENVDHVKEIVAMQQNYARVSGVAETVKVTEIVEDALRMNAGAMSRHEIALVRQYTDEPMVSIEKHKVLQILVNLIRNAKYACDESGRMDKQITLKIWKRDQWICIAVVDNGIGIPPENLTRVFNHGFTTRKDGHGFGLHSGALAARELGGSLTADSEGRGFGAVFTLELPMQPPSRDKITLAPERPGNNLATSGAIP
jgi:PAS domain S-box-containing protein